MTMIVRFPLMAGMVMLMGLQINGPVLVDMSLFVPFMGMRMFMLVRMRVFMLVAMFVLMFMGVVVFTFHMVSPPSLI